MKYAACIDRIEKEYQSLGHKLGWRFLYSPKATYSPSTPLLLVGLNPAGGALEKTHPCACVERGNAYRKEIEQWGRNNSPSTLQKQIERLFCLLAPLFGEKEPAKLMDQTMSANFVPFRSRSFAKLHERDASIEFAKELWKCILGYIDPKVTVCIGRQTCGYVQGIFEGFGYRVDETTYSPTGWGDVNVKISNLVGDNGTRLILGLPHLSRFAIFGRKATSPKLERDITTSVRRQLG